MDYDKRELDVLYQESPSHNGEEVSKLLINHLRLTSPFILRDLKFKILQEINCYTPISPYTHPYKYQI